jgi:peptide/nickel transport system ATP-binding protein
MTAPLLDVVDLHKTFELARPNWFQPHPLRRAVDGVSFVMEAGRSFGIVGESGSGKTTLARAVMALAKPTSGEVRIEGHSLFDISPANLKALRAHFQMIFQDPYGSLDPRQTVERIVAEPLANLERVRRSERHQRVIETLAEVGLDAAAAKKYPHEFSGGQRQRIAIARALITRPKLVVADEPVSALDVSIQAQVLNLMSELQREAGVTYLLISHDLAVVGHICDEIAVMFLGRIVEQGLSVDLLRRPAHPYTRELVDAAPKLEEAPPAPPEPPPRPEATTGCAYASRCFRARDVCLAKAPLLEARAGRLVACHFPLEVTQAVV